MEFHFGGFGFRILQKISEFEFFESSETKFESNEFLDYIQGLDVHEFSLINFDSNLIDYSILENFFDFIEKFTNDFRHIFSSINSVYGFFKHANCYNLRKTLYEKHFGILKMYLQPANRNYDYFIWKEPY